MSLSGGAVLHGEGRGSTQALGQPRGPQGAGAGGSGGQPGGSLGADQVFAVSLRAQGLRLLLLRSAGVKRSAHTRDSPQ